MKLLGVFAVAAMLPVAAVAQQRPDSLPLLHLNALTVTAERARAAINNLERVRSIEIGMDPLKD